MTKPGKDNYDTRPRLAFDCYVQYQYGIARHLNGRSNADWRSLGWGLALVVDFSHMLSPKVVLETK
jgi:hypothetical protein